MPRAGGSKPKSKTEMMRDMRARRKQDQETHAAYLAKERERYQQRKADGKIKTIHSRSERDQRSIRRRWKHDKRRLRPSDQVADQPVLELTPPVSPLALSPPSYQKIAGRKKLQREAKRAYRKIKSHEETIKNLRNEMKKMQRKNKKLLQHANNPECDTSSNSLNTSGTGDLDPSPRKKAKLMVKAGNMNNIQNQLTFGIALSANIKKKLQNNAMTRKKKRTCREVLNGQFLKKYRLLKKAEKDLAISRRQLKNKQNDICRTLGMDEDALCHKALSTVTKLVNAFFHRDDVSRPASGKRETLTLKKEKRLKRYLCDTLKNLRMKFLAENPQVAISYTSFTRLRPFYVVHPKVNMRDTTACKMCTNGELLATKLTQMGVLKTENIHDILSSIVCSSTDMSCMYSHCMKCKDNMSNMYTTGVDIESFREPIEYYQWQSKSETRSTFKGEIITVKVNSKELLKDSVKNVCHMFESQLREVMPHQYRVHHQYSEIRHLKKGLGADECVLQVDFSQNYECKLGTEIMSMHFGASKHQVALHTCHATFQNPSTGVVTKCYCTMSEDTRHGPGSVWAHLKPVLKDLRGNGIKKLHFISDGPRAQLTYRPIGHVPWAPRLGGPRAFK